MSISVRVNATIIEDDTGIESNIPVILTAQGVLTPLLDYLLNKQQEGRSFTWMDRVIRVTQKLLDYMEANKCGFANPRVLLQTFIKRLYSGTVGEDGFDASGLYWLPQSTRTTNQLVSALSGLTDWLAHTQNVLHMNPLIEADSYTQQLNFVAWFRKNQYDYLGHIEDKSLNKTVRKARLLRGHRELIRTDDDAVAFNEDDFEKFYLNGIGKSKDPRVALRDKLVLLLMHGGGLRGSESLSLWVNDVFEDPNDSESALVRIYHPEDGSAPDNWRSRDGRKHRKAYLMENYALTPRNRLINSQRLGWKTRVMDDRENFIQVHWFPTDYGKIFLRLWRDYLRYLASMERHHPYAFVVFRKQQFGNPYTLRAFNENYANGLKRIGLFPSKVDGYSPHGHRHSYGRRLTKAGVDPIIRKKCLHHASLESQAVYTAPNLTDVSKCLSAATLQLSELSQSDDLYAVTDWQSLIEQGFDEIDPTGLFTGKHPKLRRP